MMNVYDVPNLFVSSNLHDIILHKLFIFLLDYYNNLSKKNRGGCFT